MRLVKKEELPAGFQFLQHLPGNFLKRVEHAAPLKCHSFNHRLILPLQFFGQRFHRKHIRQIALVELKNIRNLIEVVSVFLEIRHQIVERLDVGVHTLFLRIGDKHDAVYAAQNQLAAGVIENLARNGVKVDTSLESAHRTQIQRKKVKEQCTFSFGSQRDHLALLLFGSGLIDVLKIRGLAA